MAVVLANVRRVIRFLVAMISGLKVNGIDGFQSPNLQKFVFI
jgi:hypothetical protein